MNPAAWRKAERERLLALRQALSVEYRTTQTAAITAPKIVILRIAGKSLIIVNNHFIDRKINAAQRVCQSNL